MAKSTNNNTAQVLHYDLHGKRDDKYNFLKDHNNSGLRNRKQK